MKSFKIILTSCFIFLFLHISGQKSAIKNFKQLSCPEKWWIVFHPFVAKKAYEISIHTRTITDKIKKESILIGTGNGSQIDAFRHTYWMAKLSQEIGWRKAKKLGVAHEKGNYKFYKKGKKENGVLPDKINSEMDLYNNNVGLQLGKNSKKDNLQDAVLELVVGGGCKIVKVDQYGNYLDDKENIILKEALIGKWINNKCLVNSDEVF